jgi:opine dehydrogenase
VRLTIARRIGLSVFGLRSEPRDDVWRKLTNGLRALENEHEAEIGVLREIRGKFTEYLDRSVLSAQHWLDMTYGVERRAGESLGDAIGRTPTYQDKSYPQARYIEEDVPTGLVPLEALARRLDIDCSVITDIIDRCNCEYHTDWRKSGRNLAEFTDEYILAYLRGEMSG